ncbi:MAG: hypothetical protein ABR616_18275 [Dermatophilaceae bacterium]
MTAVDVPHIAPPEYLDPMLPDKSRFGLFSVARIVDDPAIRFEAGVEYEPLACERAGLLSSICPPDEGSPAGLPMTLRAGGSTETSLPFVVYGSYDCSTFSRPFDEAENRARQHLSYGEERAVEYAIHQGGFDNGPILDDAGATDVTPAGGPVPIGRAFGLLESFLGRNYGGVGTIHAPRLASASATNVGVARRQGERMETALGTLVAFGGGYDEAQNDPDIASMYATSVVTLRRSEVFVTPDPEFRPNYRTNDVEIVAQRIYVASFECVLGVVSVDTTAGSGSGGVF